MIQKIQKWGNSLGIRIPKDITEKYSLQEGSVVIITSERKKISLRPTLKKKQNLKKIIAHITPRNRHAETDWGLVRGKELW